MMTMFMMLLFQIIHCNSVEMEKHAGKVTAGRDISP